MRTTEIKKVWYSVDNHLANDTVAHNPIQLKSSIASLLCPGPYYYYIFDFGTYEFVTISDTYTQMIGLETDGLTIDRYLSRIHPEEAEYFKRCEAAASHFLFKYLKPSEIRHYKVSYPIRFQTANGTYKLFLHQAIGISFDESGKMSRVYGVDTDISNITTTNAKRLSLIGINGRPFYTNIDVFKNAEPDFDKQTSRLTPREKEVLRHMAEGATAKEIAAVLSLSNLTVKKHRENLLKKMGAKNAAHLVAMAIKNGLI